MMKVIKKTMLFQQIILISIEGSPVDRVQFKTSNDVRLRVYDTKKKYVSQMHRIIFSYPPPLSENSPLN